MEHLEDKLKNSEQAKKEFIEAIDSYISENGVNEYIINLINKHFPEYKTLRGEIFR